jgi:alpha-tubulin suppressor-like RCC1 family protein
MVFIYPLNAIHWMPFGSHTLLHSLEGGLWAFGWNSAGQLGIGDNELCWEQLEPAKVPWNGPQPVQIDWGHEHSLVLDAEGGVWETGRSRSSPSLTFQLVSELPTITMVAAGHTHNAAIDTEGGLSVWTSEKHSIWASCTPQLVKGLPAITKVACGYCFLPAVPPSFTRKKKSARSALGSFAC